MFEKGRKEGDGRDSTSGLYSQSNKLGVGWGVDWRSVKRLGEKDCCGRRKKTGGWGIRGTLPRSGGDGNEEGLGLKAVGSGTRSWALVVGSRFPEGLEARGLRGGGQIGSVIHVSLRLGSGATAGRMRAFIRSS